MTDSDMTGSHPMDRLGESGDIAFHSGRRRRDNPYPHGSAQWELWFAEWDDAAHKLSRATHGKAAGALYRALCQIEPFLRRMDERGKRFFAKHGEVRELRIRANTALALAQGIEGIALPAPATAATAEASPCRAS